jgi:PhzF family phenazine biosynthesis protein
LHNAEPVTIERMRIPVFHLDVFTDRPFSGNPAAVCFLDSWLDDDRLRKVAAENNLPATAFLVPVSGSYELRWFTSVCEIRLCGHASVASAYVLFTRFAPQADSILFRTKFHAELKVIRQGDLCCLRLPAMRRESCSPPNGLFEALGLKSSPVEVLEANNTYLLILGDEGAVRAVAPNFSELEKFHPHAVAVTAGGSESDYACRYFAPGYGIPEDSATGSLQCSLAPYWAQRLGRSELVVRQISERSGELWCDVEDNHVVVKGKCVLTMEAALEI